ncbi:YceI family protein [Pusillimonas sp. CC-YST705]|uniref:YceI family protein n=1 Tax=Mesopusillimonas faecipullorum TaxID=2755040 RepID=A0ABS8CFZ2_9BURK|nr:YceI family protein [Mesopusillimonas faecipullorum]MCB5364928.1 YceI family protein [Mesopusillimonas faecipullorum]
MKVSFLRSAVLAAALGLGALGQATAATYTSIDGQSSKIGFGYSQMNVKMDGSFAELKAPTFSFDPANPEAAQVTLEVVLASVDAGYDEATEELAKDEWLALGAHPLATFTSTKVEALGDNRFQVTGNLTIKGITQPVTAPFTFKEDDKGGVFEGAFSFKRSDFNVGEGQWKDTSIVADDIQITFSVVGQP